MAINLGNFWESANWFNSDGDDYLESGEEICHHHPEDLRKLLWLFEFYDLARNYLVGYDERNSFWLMPFPHDCTESDIRGGGFEPMNLAWWKPNSRIDQYNNDFQGGYASSNQSDLSCGSYSGGGIVYYRCEYIAAITAWDKANNQLTVSSSSPLSCVPTHELTCSKNSFGAVSWPGGPDETFTYAVDSLNLEQLNCFRDGTPLYISGSGENDGYYRVLSRVSISGNTAVLEIDPSIKEIATDTPTGSSSCANVTFGGDYYCTNKFFSFSEIRKKLPDFCVFNGNGVDLRPPDGGEFSEDSNIYWIRSVNKWRYHHFDKNAHRYFWVLGYESDSDDGDVGWKFYAERYPSHVILPVQTDPREQADPKAYDSSYVSLSFDPVEIKATHISQANYLGPIAPCRWFNHCEVGGGFPLASRDTYGTTRGYSSDRQYLDRFYRMSFDPEDICISVLTEKDCNSWRSYSLNADLAGANTLTASYGQSNSVTVNPKNTFIERQMKKHTDEASLAAPVPQDYQSMTELYVERYPKAFLIDSVYKYHWNMVNGGDWYNTNIKQLVASSHNSLWGCNSSSFELTLTRIGYYDFYYDTKYPYTPKRILDCGARIRASYRSAYSNWPSSGVVGPDGVTYFSASDYYNGVWDTNLILGTVRRTWRYTATDFVSSNGAIRREQMISYERATEIGGLNLLGSSYSGYGTNEIEGSLDGRTFEVPYITVDPAASWFRTWYHDYTKVDDRWIYVTGDVSAYFTCGACLQFYTLESDTVDSCLGNGYVQYCYYSTSENKTYVMFHDTIPSALANGVIQGDAYLILRHDPILAVDGKLYWEPNPLLWRDIYSVLTYPGYAQAEALIKWKQFTVPEFTILSDMLEYSEPGHSSYLAAMDSQHGFARQVINALDGYPEDPNLATYNNYNCGYSTCTPTDMLCGWNFGADYDGVNNWWNWRTFVNVGYIYSHIAFSLYYSTHTVTEDGFSRYISEDTAVLLPFKAYYYPQAYPAGPGGGGWFARVYVEQMIADGIDPYASMTTCEISVDNDVLLTCPIPQLDIATWYWTAMDDLTVFGMAVCPFAEIVNTSGQSTNWAFILPEAWHKQIGTSQTNTQAASFQMASISLVDNNTDWGAAWTGASHFYEAGKRVVYENEWYRCRIEHTSAWTSPPDSNSNWSLVPNFAWDGKTVCFTLIYDQTWTDMWKRSFERPLSSDVDWTDENPPLPNPPQWRFLPTIEEVEWGQNYVVKEVGIDAYGTFFRIIALEEPEILSRNDGFAWKLGIEISGTGWFGDNLAGMYTFSSITHCTGNEYKIYVTDYISLADHGSVPAANGGDPSQAMLLKTPEYRYYIKMAAKMAQDAEENNPVTYKFDAVNCLPYIGIPLSRNSERHYWNSKVGYDPNDINNRAILLGGYQYMKDLYSTTFPNIKYQLTTADSAMNRTNATYDTPLALEDGLFPNTVKPYFITYEEVLVGGTTYDLTITCLEYFCQTADLPVRYIFAPKGYVPRPFHLTTNTLTFRYDKSDLPDLYDNGFLITVYNSAGGGFLSSGSYLNSSRSELL